MPSFIILEPSLRKFINLDPRTKVKLDKDVRPTGEFEVYTSQTNSVQYTAQTAGSKDPSIQQDSAHFPRPIRTALITRQAIYHRHWQACLLDTKMGMPLATT